ncbi:hypothetical protein B0H13DRAFT_2283216 [Mycena leptocephala]|nr:hypothetical protein B0H13DRAFT_2283216 [Mycena leptocephala]
MIALQPRFLVLLALCLAASSTALPRLEVGESEPCNEQVSPPSFSSSRRGSFCFFRPPPRRRRSPSLSPHVMRNMPDAPNPANLAAGAPAHIPVVPRDMPDTPKGPDAAHLPAGVPVSLPAVPRNIPNAPDAPKLPAGAPAAVPVPRSLPATPKTPDMPVSPQHMVRKRAPPPTPTLPLDKPATPVDKLLPIKRDETSPDVAMKDIGLNTTKRAPPTTPDLAAMLSNPHAPISAPNPRSNADVPQPLGHSAIDRQYSRDMTDTLMTGLYSAGMPSSSTEKSDDMAINRPTILEDVDSNSDPLVHSNAHQGTQDMAVAGTGTGSSGQTLHTNKHDDGNGDETEDAVVGGGLLHTDSQQTPGRRDVPVDEPNSTDNEDDKVITTPGGQPVYHEHESRAMRAHDEHRAHH